MDASELKSLQEPFKAHYKSEPSAALITLKAVSRVGENVTCRIETGKALVQAGLHPATGGDGLSACSGDMLLEALAACAGVPLSAVATATRFKMDEALVHVEGDLDFRGTLSVDRSAPVGFKAIRLRFDIKSSEPQEKTANLIRLAERYCVIYQTLARANELTVTISNKN